MPDNLDLLVATTTDLDGTLIAQTIDNDGQPNKVLQNGIANSIRVRWQLTGTLIAANVLTGSWQLQAFFERIGGGAEFSVPAAPIVIPWDPTGVYDESVPIPAGTAAVGAYKLVVLVSHLNAVGNPTRMSGFFELPLVRFY